MRNWPKFSFKSRLLMNSPPSIGRDSKENLVVSKCIKQSRFERYAGIRAILNCRGASFSRLIRVSIAILICYVSLN